MYVLQVRMGELCSALGSVMGRPSLVPVPDFALRTLLGEVRGWKQGSGSGCLRGVLWSMQRWQLGAVCSSQLVCHFTDCCGHPPPPSIPSPWPQGASVVLEGQRVVPTRAQDAGFKFKYTQVGCLGILCEIVKARAEAGLAVVWLARTDAER